MARPTTVDSVSVTYGNTLTDSSGKSYTWDFENRLSQVTLPNNGGTVSFKYDPFGRRIEKISPTTTSIFAYDGNNLVETVNSSGGEVASYAQAPNIDEPLAMDRSGTIDYYEQDGLGSVTSLTASTGTIAQSYTYDSFGNQTASSGSLTNFFRYTGREFDTETNLYYNRARYYDFSSGRFTSEDPLELAGMDIDFYRYVYNNPALLIDPSGRGAQGAAIGGAIGTVVGGVIGGVVGAAGGATTGTLVAPGVGTIGGGFGGGTYGAAIGGTAGLAVGAAIGNFVQDNAQTISDFLSYFAKGWTGTADTGIMEQVYEMIRLKQAKDICDALAKLAAKADCSATLAKIRATQKFYNCRRSHY